MSDPASSRRRHPTRQPPSLVTSCVVLPVSASPHLGVGPGKNDEVTGQHGERFALRKAGGAGGAKLWSARTLLRSLPRVYSVDSMFASRRSDRRFSCFCSRRRAGN